MELAQNFFIGTKKLAALKTYNIWSWLSTHPGKEKKDYPLYYELGFDKLIDACPWCDISFSCKNCPLDKEGYRCFTGQISLYRIWVDYKFFDKNYNKKEKCEAAGEIANVAWREYKRLGG